MFVSILIYCFCYYLLIVVGGEDDAPAPSSNNLEGGTSIIEIDQEPRTVVRVRTNTGSLPVAATVVGGEDDAPACTIFKQPGGGFFYHRN